MNSNLRKTVALGALMCLVVIVALGLLFLPIITGWQLHKQRVKQVHDKQLVGALEECFRELMSGNGNDLASFHQTLHRYGIDDAYITLGKNVGISPKSLVIEFGGADHHYGLVITEEGENPGDPWGNARPRKIGAISWFYDQAVTD